MLLRMRLFDPDPPLPDPVTDLDGLIEAYLAHLAAVAGLASTTCANHGVYLRHFLDWWARERPGRSPLGAVAADLADFLVHEAGRGIRAATRAAQAAMLRRFYAWLLLTGRTTATPAVALGAPRVPPRDPEFYRPEQARAILDHSGGLADLRGRQRHALVSFLRYTGVRSRELRTLPVAEVDLSAGHAKVVGKGSRPRAVLLPAPLVDVLETHLSEVRPELPASDLLFVNPRSYGHPSRTGSSRRPSAARSSSRGSAPACPAATTRTSGGTPTRPSSSAPGSTSTRCSASSATPRSARPWDTPTSPSTTCAPPSPACGRDRRRRWGATPRGRRRAPVLPAGAR